MKRIRGITSVLISLVLLYHLFAILLLPNGHSILGRHLGHLFSGYASTLGFNTTWQFFSPGPSPTFYLEYEAEKKDDSVEGPFSYPPRRQGMGWDDRFNRRVYTMRFFALIGDNMEKYFVPYLCRQHADAARISVRYITEQYPMIEKFETEGGSFAENSERLESMQARTFNCPTEGEGAP